MLSVIGFVLYIPIDVWIHAVDGVDYALAVIMGIIFYGLTAFILFLITWLCYDMLDAAGVKVSEQSATVASLLFKEASTTLLPVQSGSVLIMVPQFHSACWQVNLRVGDEIWQTDISESKGSAFTPGEKVTILYRKGRISGRAHITDVVCA